MQTYSHLSKMMLVDQDVCQSCIGLTSAMKAEVRRSRAKPVMVVTAAAILSYHTVKDTSEACMIKRKSEGGYVRELMIYSRVGVACVDQDTEVEITKGEHYSLRVDEYYSKLIAHTKKRLATCRCHFGTLLRLLSVRELSKLLVPSNHKHPVGVSVGEHAPSAKRQKNPQRPIQSLREYDNERDSEMSLIPMMMRIVCRIALP
jgi:hypothetical protein